MQTIQPNAHVTLDYQLKDDEGEVIGGSDGDGEPIRYVHGYSMIVPGLERALDGLGVGDEREIVVPAEAGYGEYDEELVLEIDRKEFPDPDKVKAGDEFVAESPDGGEVEMAVVEVRDDVVVVDANHPLAGMTLHYKIKVTAVREATSEEIESAASDLEAAAHGHGHVHGPDCDHDHDHDHESLVQLGKKKDLLN